MDKVPGRPALFTIQNEQGAPSLEEAARKLGLAASDLEDAFGVVLLDPKRGMYCVQVRGEKVDQVAEGEEKQGPFADPEIKPFAFG